MTEVLIRRRNFDMDTYTRRMPWENEDKDQGKQCKPRNIKDSKPPEARKEAWDRSSLLHCSQEELTLMTD